LSVRYVGEWDEALPWNEAGDTLFDGRREAPISP
jgi:hypothetical protein